MLKKEICLNCQLNDWLKEHDEHYIRICFKRAWRAKEVYCAHWSQKFTKGTKTLDTKGEPPEYCPYVLEHTVNA